MNLLIFKKRRVCIINDTMHHSYAKTLFLFVFWYLICSKGKGEMAKVALYFSVLYMTLQLLFPMLYPSHNGVVTIKYSNKTEVLSFFFCYYFVQKCFHFCFISIVQKCFHFFYWLKVFSLLALCSHLS